MTIADTRLGQVGSHDIKHTGCFGLIPRHAHSQSVALQVEKRAHGEANVVALHRRP
jgi:hypothetical protein